jgi:hypothetical protein
MQNLRERTLHARRITFSAVHNFCNPQGGRAVFPRAIYGKHKVKEQQPRIRLVLIFNLLESILLASSKLAESINQNQHPQQVEREYRQTENKEKSTLKKWLRLTIKKILPTSTIAGISTDVSNMVLSLQAKVA